MLLNFRFRLNYSDSGAMARNSAPLAFFDFLIFFARLTPGARFSGTAVARMLRSAAICSARQSVTGISCDNHVLVCRICSGPTLGQAEVGRPTLFSHERAERFGRLLWPFPPTHSQPRPEAPLLAPHPLLGLTAAFSEITIPYGIGSLVWGFWD